MSNVLDALIGRVHDTDPALASAILAEVKKLQNRREYGLVYEAHAPEGVRLWGKKVLTGDIVNVLPPRGVMETKENSLEWKVVSINRKDRAAHVIRKINDTTYDEKDVSLDDLVVYADFRQTIYPGLVEVDSVERGGKDDPYHVVINGENFHALQAMLWCYAGKVDCIYIDPPYNTGAKDWKYNNDYVDGSDQYKHSKWLSFMEQRLKLAKKLLNPKDSVLIVTIDEKEYLRLGMLLEQMFPEARIQMVSMVINPHGANRVGAFARLEEYIYVIMFGDSKVIPQKESDVQSEIRWMYLRRPDLDSMRGTVKGGTAQFYPIYVDDNTLKIVKIGDALPVGVSRFSVPHIDGATAVFPVREDGTELNWGVTGKTLERLIKNGLVRVSKSNNLLQPYIFKYTSENYKKKVESGEWAVQGVREDGSIIIIQNSGKNKPARTILSEKKYEAGAYGSILLKNIFGDKRFQYPKSLYAVEDCLRFFVADKPNALIMDFFAGSGTTAHATMLLNHLDGGHRKSISITNNEIGPTVEKDFVTKKLLRPTDAEWQKYGIAKYITWERIKAALTGINTKGEPIKGDYKFTEEFPMSEGFKENAVFFDLKYEDGKAIRLNMAFQDIAPLLWIRAGCKGHIIDKINAKGYDISEQYAILFDFMASKNFVRDIQNASVKVVYIITDSEPLYQQIYKQLPRSVEPVRLYENYLTSFAIYGAV